MTEPQPIATLPPIEEVQGVVPRSPRTGEPRRPAVVLVAAVLLYLGAGALAVAYGVHWWLAAHPESYPTSARLIQWTAPEPGKWLSLTLEGVFAASLVVAAGACGVVGFQGWNGWRWVRWGGLVALGLAGGFATVLNDWAFIGVGLAVPAVVLLFLPPATRYFAQWEQVRAERPVLYRRPESIHYGRLPRFR
ncbi:hypothetical protein [Tessaracoccus sp. G1721]